MLAVQYCCKALHFILKFPAKSTYQVITFSVKGLVHVITNSREVHSLEKTVIIDLKSSMFAITAPFISCRIEPLTTFNSYLAKKTFLFASVMALQKLWKKFFNFVLKIIFVLKKLKFLSRVFGHVGKTTGLER